MDSESRKIFKCTAEFYPHDPFGMPPRILKTCISVAKNSAEARKAMETEYNHIDGPVGVDVIEIIPPEGVTCEQAVALFRDFGVTII